MRLRRIALSAEIHDLLVPIAVHISQACLHASVDETWHDRVNDLYSLVVIPQNSALAGLFVRDSNHDLQSPLKGIQISDSDAGESGRSSGINGKSVHRRAGPGPCIEICRLRGGVRRFAEGKDLEVSVLIQVRQDRRPVKATVRGLRPAGQGLARMIEPVYSDRSGDEYLREAVPVNVADRRRRKVVAQLAGSGERDRPSPLHGSIMPEYVKFPAEGVEYDHLLESVIVYICKGGIAESSKRVLNIVEPSVLEGRVNAHQGFVLIDLACAVGDGEPECVIARGHRSRIPREQETIRHRGVRFNKNAVGQRAVSFSILQTEALETAARRRSNHAHRIEQKSMIGRLFDPGSARIGDLQ